MGEERRGDEMGGERRGEERRGDEMGEERRGEERRGEEECSFPYTRAASKLQEPHRTVPVCGRVHTSAAVRASILYRKWLLRQRSNVSCEALRLSAPSSLSPL